MCEFMRIVCVFVCGTMAMTEANTRKKHGNTSSSDARKMQFLPKTKSIEILVARGLRGLADDTIDGFVSLCMTFV